jgi:hypothetical protein
MKPNFALSLSFDGIRLLHRVSGGWHLVGEAAFDAEDLAGELTMLRRTAQVLDPSGIRSKILIPNDQIKYLVLDTPNASDDDIRAALDGTTPYALDELAIDSSRDDTSTYVAAVARETLDEALDFARQHRFQPTSFAAVPEDGSFSGEVFFGAADPQISVERDSEPVRVIGTAKSPSSAPVVEDMEPEAIADDDALTAEEEAQEEDGSVQEAQSEPETLADTEAEPDDAPAKETDGIGDQTPIFSSRTKPLRIDLDVPPATRSAPAAPLREVEGEPVFASRGRQEPPPLGKTDGKKAGNMPPLPSALQVASASLDPAEEFDDEAIDLEDQAKSGNPELRSILSAGAAVAGGGRAKSSARRSPLSKVAEPQSEKADQPAKSGNSAGYLWLILTAILLVFLAAVGIWASVTDTALSRLIFGPQDAVTDVAFGDPVIYTPETETPTVDEEELADLADLADLPPDEIPPDEASADEIVAASETTDTGTAEAVSLPVVSSPTVLSPAEAERIYVSTGVWLRAPRLPLTPRTESSDRIFLAAIDPTIGGADAIALPDLLRTGRDAPLEAQALPPPPGTVYQRDSEGFILATAEGTLLPSGIVVVAGAPAVVPPQRPIFETVEETAADAQGEDAVALEVASPVDPALVGKRPKIRPTALAETIERASLGGRTLDELSGIRPKSRPQSLAIAEAPADAIAEALAAAAGDPFADATELAVPSSERPQSRPRNFDRVVAAASTAPKPAAAPAIVQGSSGPVPRSVAEAATVDNAISLRDLALIGLMGPSNDRRAMLRTSFGRILLVRVGDELDGGRVTSIGENALTYTKRGRTYTLEMPAG